MRRKLIEKVAAIIITEKNDKQKPYYLKKKTNPAVLAAIGALGGAIPGIFGGKKGAAIGAALGGAALGGMSLSANLSRDIKVEKARKAIAEGTSPKEAMKSIGVHEPDKRLVKHLLYQDSLKEVLGKK